MGLKYTIHGFQQARLIEQGLTNNDALILSVIKEMYATSSMEYKIIDGKRYIWINYSYLIKDVIPILYPIKSKRENKTNNFKSNLMAKIKKYGDMGLLDRKKENEKYNPIKGKIEKGNYAYVCVTEKLDLLSEYANLDKLQEKSLHLLKRGIKVENLTLSKNKITLIQKKDNPLSKKKTTKILPLLDTPINNTTTTECTHSKEENGNEENKTVVVENNKKSKFTQKDIEELNEKINNQIGQKVNDKTLKNVLTKFGYDYVLPVINKLANIISKNVYSIDSFLYKAIESESKGMPYIEKTNSYNQRPVQNTNYEQREYDDSFWDDCYDNFRIEV